MEPVFTHGSAEFYSADCLAWLRQREENSIHGVVTDPPYGLVEYTAKENEKRIKGQGGIWRIPPSFDGHKRSPLPRFSVLTQDDLENLFRFFNDWAKALLPALVPGAHVMVASNPLVSNMLSAAIQMAGYDRRGEVIRLVQTMRGGDRPKNAHDDFPDVSVMPKSQYEPWVLFRRPLEGRVQDNLREWKTGGLRRISAERPFGDVIPSHPTRKHERELAPHPSLKPQSFLRQAVRAILPLGEGVVLDPFAGTGSTLAAAEAVGYRSIGIEMDPEYVEVARRGIPALKDFEVGEPERHKRTQRRVSASGRPSAGREQESTRPVSIPNHYPPTKEQGRLNVNGRTHGDGHGERHLNGHNEQTSNGRSTLPAEAVDPARHRETAH